MNSSALLKCFIFNSILQLGMGEKNTEQLNNVWFAGSRIKILLNTSLIIARMFTRRDNLVSFMLLLWELFHEIEQFLTHEFYISTLLNAAQTLYCYCCRNFLNYYKKPVFSLLVFIGSKHH